jgi:replicative DNA helicase
MSMAVASPQRAPTSGPSNLEAEQALLGAVLFDNEAYHRVIALEARDFSEPFHGRLWEAMERLIQRGRGAEPIVLIDQFRDDPAFNDLGGLRYLADLVDRAPPGFSAPTYAEQVKELAMRRGLVRIAGDMIERANSDHETPGADQIVETEAELYRLAEVRSGAAGGFVTFETVVHGAVGMAEEAFARDGGLVGLSTGLIDLDQKLGGLHPSDLLILAGRPSMGKTALATNIAFHVAREGAPVGFFSLEMSGEQLALRILSEVSGVSGDKIRKGATDATEIARIRDAGEEIARTPLFVDATGGLAIAKLTARARRLKRLHGLRLIVVDYLQLVTVSSKPGANRVNEVSEVTMGLKALAKELGVPVIALSQLSRAVEQRDDKRPQLSDLRESGSIEQDADAVMFVFREAYYLGRAEPREGSPEHLEWQEQMDQLRHVAEVIIGKQRHGPIGTVRLSFNDDTTKFGNLGRPNHFAAAAPLNPRYSFGAPE